MKIKTTALISGVLFGVGLSLAQMINPNKVQNFLDITGQWDASLLFVMLGALPVALIAFRLVLKRPTPIFTEQFQLSPKKDTDKRLIIGSAIFGIGWGLAGYCPGPAVAGLGLFSFESIIMVVAIYLGFVSYYWLFERE
ncbi:MAG: YeeE/YedE family protein [Methylococcaceae bacterium]